MVIVKRQNTLDIESHRKNDYGFGLKQTHTNDYRSKRTSTNGNKL